MTGNRLTQKEIRERFLQAIREGAAAAGPELAEQGRKFLQIAAKKARPNPEDHRFAAAHHILAAQLHLLYGQLTKEAKRLALKGCTEEELQTGLDQVKALIAKGPTLARKEMDKMKEILPRRGGPGRKELLDDSDKRVAINHVSYQIGPRGLTLKDAFESAAEALSRPNRKVRARTIRRVWEKRRELQ